jgi:hypothetical protein
MQNREILSKYANSNIGREDMRPEFHINTLLHRINKQLENQAPKSRENWNSLIEWGEKTKEFVANLPKKILVRDGVTKEKVDPFEPCHQAFGYEEGKFYESKTLYKCIEEMHYSCLGKLPTEHLNLVEVLENCGLLEEDCSKEFSKEILGRDQSPKEIMEDFIHEMEGGTILKENSKNEISQDGSALYQDNKNSQKSAWINQDTIGAIGYHGQISTFMLFRSENHCVIIQDRHMQGTSVTNLAEILRDKIKETFGQNTKVYEAYEQDAINGKFSQVDEIIGESGESPGWLTVQAETIPGLRDYTLNE